MALIPVELGARAYRVHVGDRLLEGIGDLAGDVLHSYRAGGRPVPVVVDGNARRLHGERLAAGLAAAGLEPSWYDITPGEAAKSWQGLAALVDWLLAQGVERGDHVLALGGGVVGDLAGFACAIVKRGCGLVQLPTTLLAQVDSSVGGKTAINTAAGKNLVGAFHQPAMVIADLGALDTLPMREMRAGYAEVLKYGLLGDAAFFAWLERDGPAVLARDRAALEHAVATSVGAKAAIIAEDEHERTGRRALLNLGHTFGHALEAQTGFGERLLHGEAVAMGMVLAARYSARLGLLPAAEAERAARAIAEAGLPAALADLSLNCDGRALVDHMRHDKKMEGGTLPFILLRGIGTAFVARDIDPDDVARFLDEQLTGS